MIIHDLIYHQRIKSFFTYHPSRTPERGELCLLQMAESGRWYPQHEPGWIARSGFLLFALAHANTCSKWCFNETGQQFEKGRTTPFKIDDFWVFYAVLSFLTGWCYGFTFGSSKCERRLLETAFVVQSTILKAVLANLVVWSTHPSGIGIGSGILKRPHEI